MDRKARLTEIFRDTQVFYRKNAMLASAVQHSTENTVFYPAEAYPAIKDRPAAAGLVTVSKRKTFEAAMQLNRENPNAKIAVLNFASATNPGGGVKHGSSAQEESLCRCSTLFPTLDQQRLWDCYYLPNRADANPLHTDACIYSPGIVICKTDDDYPERLADKDFVTVDVITCAAPNLRRRPGNQYNPCDSDPVRIGAKDLFALHFRRAKHILHIAAANETDILVLGAFGCGAFCNDPIIVANAYADALKEYANCFQQIDFAIYCQDWKTENYDAFKSVFGRTNSRE